MRDLLRRVHLLVALDEQRLGLSVLALAREARAEQAHRVVARPVIGLPQPEALAQDGLCLGVLLLLEQAHAQYRERSVGPHVLDERTARETRLREIGGSSTGFTCRPLWLTGEDLVALQEQLPENSFNTRRSKLEHYFRHDYRDWRLEVQDMPRIADEQSIFRLVVGRKAKLPPLGDVPEEDFPWDRLLDG